LKYRVKFNLFDMITFEVQTKSIEYFESDLLPDEVVNLLFSTEPFPMDLTVTADEHCDYSELTLRHRSYSVESEYDNFVRERQILNECFTPIESIDVPKDQDPTSYNTATTLKINLFTYMNPNAREEIDRTFNSVNGYSYIYTSHHRVEIGASGEFYWLNVIIDYLKTFIDVFTIFIFLKSIYDKYAPKETAELDISDSEFNRQYKRIQLQDYLIAISKNINTPLDKINLRFQSLTLDGTYMVVKTDKGTYSVSFDNKRQIITLNKLDD
jgi:hypothetical protein